MGEMSGVGMEGGREEWQDIGTKRNEDTGRRILSPFCNVLYLFLVSLSLSLSLSLSIYTMLTQSFMLRLSLGYKFLHP